jgi:signal transduction histidine kinase
MTYGESGKAGTGSTVRGAAAWQDDSSPDAGGDELNVVKFSGDLAHDLLTPLNIIIGFSELLLQEIPGKINKEQRRDLNDILNSGRRLLGLVQAMLERSESEARRAP